MKIAIVTYALQIGGVEGFIKCLADYCIGTGHDVVIIETLKKGLWSQHFVSNGYKVHQIFGIPYRSRVNHAKRIARYLAPYDLVVLNDSPFAQASLGLLPEATIAIPVLHSRVTSMLSNAVANDNNWDALVTVSPGLRDLVVHYGAVSERTICIPSGIDVPKVWPKINSTAVVSDPLRLAYVGMLTQAKGVHHLPNILADAICIYPKIQFDIIGDGPELPALRERFANHGKISLVFHGSLSNKEAMSILAQADALIMPSYFEGLPIVLLEAIAYGVVPIVSRLEGITDFVITDGVDGRLISVGDEKGFAEAIIMLARDRSMLRGMSRKAWETSVSRFSYQVMGKAYLSLAEELHKQREKTGAKRNGIIDVTLLGDFPYLPIALVRPMRKLLRMLGLYKDAATMPLLYEPSDFRQDA